MKKVFISLLSIILLFCLASCNDILDIEDVRESIAGSSEVVKVSSAKTTQDLTFYVRWQAFVQGTSDEQIDQMIH